MDVNQISSSFLSNFEDFINTSDLEKLEKISGYTLIKELGKNPNAKLQFLSQGVNSKELILYFLLKTMENVKEHFSDYNGDITSELIQLFKRFSHIRLKWYSNPEKKTIHANVIYGNKRQLSVKSRGTYYTPKFMSEFMCEESIQRISRQKIATLEKIIQQTKANSDIFQIQHLIDFLPVRVIDLSMGIGNFLCEVIPYLKIHFQTLMKKIDEDLIPILSKTDAELVSKSIQFHSNAFLGEFICKDCLYGIEIDSNIHKMAEIIVSLKINSVLGCCVDLHSNLLCKNTIMTLQKAPENAEIETLLKNLNGFIFSEQFPEVFGHENGGFDLILGNPPWEILKPNNREFFSNYITEFLQLNRTKQDEFQTQILKNRTLRNVYDKYSHKIMSQIEAISSLEFSHQSSRIHNKVYTGDSQLFKFFLEIAFNVVKNEGIISLIVQHNFLGSKSCANLRKLYVNNGKLHGIWEFHNRSDEETYFLNVDPNLRFIVFQFQKQEKHQSDIYYKKCHSIKDLNSKFLPFQVTTPDFYTRVSGEELQLFGFENKEHRSVFEKILAANNDLSNFAWKTRGLCVNFSQDLHVTRDRDKFSNVRTSVSIYGGRSFGPYYFQPIKERYLKENGYLNLKLPESSIICRNILPNSAKRIIFSTPPDKALVDNSCTRLFLENKDDDVLYFILSVSNSLLVENYLRTILTGMNLNYYLIRRIPMPSHTTLSNQKCTNTISDLIEITKKASQIPLETIGWARAYAKIEAMVAILFNLTKKELEVILDSFDFNKLQKTKFCGFRPFQELTKKLIIDYFESESSRLT